MFRLAKSLSKNEQETKFVHFLNFYFISRLHYYSSVIAYIPINSYIGYLHCSKPLL